MFDEIVSRHLTVVIVILNTNLEALDGSKGTSIHLQNCQQVKTKELATPKGVKRLFDTK